MRASHNEVFGVVNVRNTVEIASGDFYYVPREIRI